VRTLARIRPRRSHQAERPGDIGIATAELGLRIDVLALDSGRKMNSVKPVGGAGGSDCIATIDRGARRHVYVRQVAQRNLEPGDRFERDRSHAGHRAGEGDPTRGRSSHRGAPSRGVVDAPVAAIRTDRDIVVDDRPLDRGDETYRAQGESEQHLNPPDTEPTGTRFGRQGV
jgi:hypothetical protein